VFIYIENKRCSSGQLRTFFTKVIYCEYKRDANVEMAVFTGRLAIDVYNYERIQGVVNESKIGDWKSVLKDKKEFV
jgi:hypothetical protein